MLLPEFETFFITCYSERYLVGYAVFSEVIFSWSLFLYICIRQLEPP